MTNEDTKTEMQNDEMDADEFHEKMSELEHGDTEPTPDTDAELLTFNELLEFREDMTEVDSQLDETAAYYAQVAEVVDEQANVAEARDEKEKVDVLRETAQRARELSQRIDNGEAVDEIRDE